MTFEPPLLMFGFGAQFGSSSRARFARRWVRGAARIGGLGAMLMASVGCQNITGSVPISQVRIIDASPDSEGLDIYQGGSALAYNLGFGTVTSYVGIAPGISTVSADTTGTKQQVSTVKGTFTASTAYTVLIGDVSANLSETVIMDQSVAAPAGQISVRVLDQATRPTAGVDVYLVPNGSTLPMATPILTDVVFGSNSGYLNVPAGTYSIVILPKGTVPTATTVSSFTGAKVTYAVGAVRTFVLLDQQVIATPGVQVITANDFDSPAATN